MHSLLRLILYNKNILFFSRYLFNMRRGIEVRNYNYINFPSLLAFMSLDKFNYVLNSVAATCMIRQ